MDDEELAIGIDLGTTFSCAAVLRNGKVEIIPNEIGENLTPSIVSFVDGGVLVGEQTFNHLIKNPKKTIYSIKRLMGRDFNDKEVQQDIKSNFYTFDIVSKKKSQRPFIKIEKDFYFPELISKFILEKIIQSARNYLKQSVQKVVITVPAYFNNEQRNSTKFAAEEAGLEVLRIINEPTAASLAYGLDKKLPKNQKLRNDFCDVNKLINSDNIDNENKKMEKKEEVEKLIIVFDLGGGTFDVTLLKIEEQEIFNVIATSGDSHLGGDDFNKKIIDYCLKNFSSKTQIGEDSIRKNSKAMNRLKIAAENTKIKLSSELEATIDIDDFYNNELLHIELTRELFENLCKDLFDKIYLPLDKVLNDAKKNISEVNEVVFVGGSTRIPKIKDLIKNYFSDIHINDSINPDETVAYGAAIQAAKLMKQGGDILNDVILMDITPFSLGVQTKNSNDNEKIRKKGSLMSVIIPRGSKIPIKKKRGYTTTYDFQTMVKIEVYEGEKKYVKDNHLLGEFNLVNLPPKKAREVTFDETFSIDSDGILTVTAIETSNGIQSSIKIINDRGFNKDEIKCLYQPLINNDCKKFTNYKKDMSFYIKEFNNSKSTEEKCTYINNFGKTLINFLNEFDKEGNDTLGNKYFLYIKTLFESFRILIQIKNFINENDKNNLINNSKKFLEILSTFKNINYKHYIELLNLFVIPLSKKEKKNSSEFINRITESRDVILYNLVTYVIKLIEKKAEKILSNNNKFSRYNAKYLFQNCLKISELFIKSERDLAKFFEIRKEHNYYIDKCKVEIKKINANSLIEIDKIKKSGKLIENGENMNREELLILLDNYRQAIQNIEGINDYLSESILLANIVKIKYKYLNNENYEQLRIFAEQSVRLAKSNNTNVEQYKWYLEITSILKELRKRKEDQERYDQENFENKYKTQQKQIFEKIKQFRQKSNIEFIQFVLENYPPKKSPLNKKTIEEEWNEDKKSFVTKLSARYNPDNYPKNTEEEKFKFTIYHTISIEINAILSELNSVTNSLKE
jgi:L1 cell adhesion molecule like protein